MANEGSTKPEHDSAKYWEAEAKRYCQNADYWRAELLRVRGLLQRADEMRGHALVELSMMQSDRDDLRTALDEIVEKGEKHHYAPTLSKFTGDGMLCNVIDMAKRALEFSRRIPQGAESADIGKLDTADESGVEMGKVSRIDVGCEKDSSHRWSGGACFDCGSRVVAKYTHPDGSTEIKPVLSTFRQSPVPVQHGAESAGLGKVNSADETPCLTHSAYTKSVRGICQDCGSAVPDISKLPEQKLAGSAETGGEKAAPSPLSRVNFFGTRGHEGGVEAYLERTSDTTFALRTGRGYLLMSDIPASVADSLTWPTDPGPESREPEKLNNAHTGAVSSGYLRYLDMQKDVLAESSLSSPPPDIDG